MKALQKALRPSSAPVAGLEAMKDELEAEARARWERERAKAGRDARSLLHNGQRVNLQPQRLRGR